MDEIDALCPKRDSSTSASSQRITTLLLTLMDGCVDSSSKHKIFFIGATNMPSALDSALRRPEDLTVKLKYLLQAKTDSLF